MRGQCNCCKLGFVAHLSKKERDECRSKDTKVPRYLRFFFLDFVGDHRPDRHADKRQS